MIVDVDDGTDMGLASRLQFLIGDESVRNFANRMHVKESSLRSVLKGTRPSVDFVITIATNANVSLEWLATGVGRPHLTEKEGEPTHLDRELFDMIAAVVERVHADMSLQISPGAIAATIMDYYYDVAQLASPGDTDEYRALMPWVEYGVRKEAHHHKQLS